MKANILRLEHSEGGNVEIIDYKSVDWLPDRLLGGRGTGGRGPFSTSYMKQVGNSNWNILNPSKFQVVNWSFLLTPITINFLFCFFFFFFCLYTQRKVGKAYAFHKFHFLWKSTKFGSFLSYVCVEYSYCFCCF